MEDKMAKCVSPCDTTEDGICGGHGTVWTCHPVISLDDLEVILNEADKVCFMPDEDIFTVDAVRNLVTKRKGFLFSLREDGAVEISKVG